MSPPDTPTRWNVDTPLPTISVARHLLYATKIVYVLVLFSFSSCFCFWKLAAWFSWMFVSFFFFFFYIHLYLPSTKKSLPCRKIENNHRHHRKQKIEENKYNNLIIIYVNSVRVCVCACYTTLHIIYKIYINGKRSKLNTNCFLSLVISIFFFVF